MKVISITQAEFDQIMQMDTDMDSVNVTYDIIPGGRGLKSRAVDLGVAYVNEASQLADVGCHMELTTIE